MVPPCVAEPREQVPQLAARLRVESRGRLVEKQEIRIAGQRARHRKPLFLAARELAHPAAALRFQLDDPKQSRRWCGRDDRTIGTAAAFPRPSASRRAVSPAAGRRAAAAARVRASLHRRPRISTSPASGSSSPSRISIVVVLPAPFGPSSPKHSPRSTRKREPVDRDDISVTLHQICAHSRQP